MSEVGEVEGRDYPSPALDPPVGSQVQEQVSKVPLGRRTQEGPATPELSPDGSCDGSVASTFLILMEDHSGRTAPRLLNPQALC